MIPERLFHDDGDDDADDGDRVCVCVRCAALLGADGRSAWKFGGHEWVQHTAHARNHSDGDKKQPTCGRKGRKEGEIGGILVPVQPIWVTRKG